MLGGVLTNRAARHMEQRPQEALAGEFSNCRHAARALRASAAQQIEQDGFRLVVEMMRYRNRVDAKLCEGCAARCTRRRLQSQILFFYFYSNRFERNSKVKAKRRTESLPFPRVRTQTMIDVDRRKP